MASLKMLHKCRSGHINWVMDKDLDENGKPVCMHCHRGVTIAQLESFLTTQGGIVKGTSKQYYTTRQLIDLECTKGHHSWQTTWMNLKFKHKWCPFCSKFQTENKIRKVFEEHYKVEFPSVRPEWLHGMELDGYNELLNIAFEYNGLQHYQYDQFFHKKNMANFDLLQERDANKAEMCEKRKILLFVIPYTMSPEDVARMLAC